MCVNHHFSLQSERSLRAEYEPAYVTMGGGIRTLWIDTELVTTRESDYVVPCGGLDINVFFTAGWGQNVGDLVGFSDKGNTAKEGGSPSPALLCQWGTEGRLLRDTPEPSHFVLGNSSSGCSSRGLCPDLSQKLGAGQAGNPQ